jgi:hypothetical protein
VYDMKQYILDHIGLVAWHIDPPLCFLDLHFVVYKCSTSSIRYLVRLRVPLFPGGPAMPLKSVLLNLLLDPFLSG